MPDIDTYRDLHPQERVAARSQYHRRFSFAADLADDADVIRLGPMPSGIKPVGGYLDVSGTLGAGCTIQLRLGGTAITAATTAGGASQVPVDPALHNPPTDFAREELDILVGGADFAAGADVEVHMEYEEAPALAA